MEAGRQSKFKIGAIIQARMKSVRLPGKVLMPLPFDTKTPLLFWPISRLKTSKLINQIVLATSIQPENEPLKKLAKDMDIDFYAGDEDNVLKRFVEVIEKYNLDIVIRLTGDNPLIDISLVEHLIQIHITTNSDYTYSVNLPIGMNIELFNSDCLLSLKANSNLTKDDKEHVTLYLKESGKFKVLLYSFPGIQPREDIRLTIDYAADYAMLNIVMQICHFKKIYGMKLVSYIDTHYPWLWKINNMHLQKRRFSSL